MTSTKNGSAKRLAKYKAHPAKVIANKSDRRKRHLKRLARKLAQYKERSWNPAGIEREIAAVEARK